MGKRRAPVMSFGDAFKLTNGLATAFMQQGMNKEVAETMASKATETIGGDYQKEMGLNAAPEQADQLKAQDADFGKDGASSTADALNSNAADPTPASAKGLTTRYKMLGAESDKPFTTEQADDLRMSKVADIYAKHGLLDKSTAIKDKLRETRRQNATDDRATEEYGWKKEDRATARTKAVADAAAQQGASKLITDNLDAQEGSKNFATYQTDLANSVQGKGLEATIRANAGKDATPSEIDAAVNAYRQSIGDATAEHNAAGAENLNKQLAGLYAGIGNDPDKAMKFLKIAESEGAPKLVEALKNGEIDTANQLWNSQGNHRGDLVKSTIKDNKTGDMYAEVVNAYSGKTRHENISAMERALLSATDIAKLRKTESDIAENAAQTANAYAGVEEKRASIGKTRAETAGVGLENDYMRTHGGQKPSKASDAKEKELSFNDTREVLGDIKGDRISQLSGKVTVVPNTEREKRYMAYLKSTGKANTQQNAIEWKSNDAAAPAKPKTPFDPKQFMH